MLIRKVSVFLHATFHTQDRGRLIAQGLEDHDKISYTKGSCILGHYRNRMATLQNRFKSNCKSYNQGSCTESS